MLGFASGFTMTGSAVIWPNYFGRRFLGAIRGIVFPVQVALTGLGPPVYGLLLDAGLSPTTLWVISTGFFATAGLLLFQAKPPQRKVSEQGTLSDGGAEGHGADTR